ncbi:hypothetical protein Skr01_28750 [Sphaerisporangium krabiense]|uniref:Uncharacterized protein n=1 Tax=Sphaerisporangium krabiense TaxID=763782 RepID=A0A7W8ZA74_9ACTN|nr:hypothetical protein [Sphaerisporangium krabiense]MBB5630258.1 hypothetical protein [Sphaerisporangium krabiense]GII62790.1 hypothetical protein Skr01_28750 [Sphaerisporangium krabiense]
MTPTKIPPTVSAPSGTGEGSARTATVPGTTWDSMPSPAEDDGAGHAPILVELAIRRRDGNAAPNSLVAGIRILSLLPRNWRKDLQQTGEGMALRVYADVLPAARIREEVAAVLTNPEVGEWEVAACRTLSPQV